MPSRFITTDGRIDESAIVAAVAASNRQREWTKGRPATSEEINADHAFYRREAKREQAMHAGFTEQQWLAGLSFTNGALSGLADPVDMSDYRTPANVSGSYERAQHWTSMLADRQAAARRAAFDRALDVVAARRGYLMAAE